LSRETWYSYRVGQQLSRHLPTYLCVTSYVFVASSTSSDFDHQAMQKRLGEKWEEEYQVIGHKFNQGWFVKRMTWCLSTQAAACSQVHVELSATFSVGHFRCGWMRLMHNSRNSPPALRLAYGVYDAVSSIWVLLWVWKSACQGHVPRRTGNLPYSVCSGEMLPLR